jgi:hypothetical protein
MVTTEHLEITLLESAQAQKEITVNEALARIDAILNCGAIDKDLATPPGSPAAGDVYIVAAAATGAWAGKSGQIAYFDQLWRFIAPNEGAMLWVNDEDAHYVFDGTAWQVMSSGGGGGSGDMLAASYDPANINQQVVGTMATQTLANKTLTSPIIGGNPCGAIPLVAEGRLTLTSGVPVTLADVTGATTLYYTPYQGNKIALYTGALWVQHAFSEMSLALGTLTSGRPYDVFLDYNGGTPQLTLLAWTNDTTRATTLVRQDGVLVKTGDAEQRYLGTFYTTATTTTEDSAAKRFVWNMYHRVTRQMRVVEPANSWNYSTASYRQVNGNTANQLDFVRGLAEDAVEAVCTVGLTSTANATVTTSIGLDSTSAIAAPDVLNSFIGVSSSGASLGSFAMYKGMPSAGRHFLAWLEFGGGAGTQTWYGDNGGIIIQNGISGITRG